MRRLLAALAALAIAGPAPAADGVRIVALQPSRTDSTLDCTLVTQGLPDRASRETLASGLPSSILLRFALVDASGRERRGASAEIRFEPDAWERNLVVRTPGRRQRLAGFGELEAWLQRMGPFAVAPFERVDPTRPLRLRVRLDVHPLAPAEAERTRALFSGSMSGGGAERREVSAGLGSLLRFFLGRSPAREGQVEALSEPFDPRSLERSP